MKKKRFALIASLFGLGSLIMTSVVIKQQLDERKRQQVMTDVRAFFAHFGTIEVVYINDFESTPKHIKGGVVFDDGIVFQFSYQDGEIDYKEDKE